MRLQKSVFTVCEYDISVIHQEITQTYILCYDSDLLKCQAAFKCTVSFGADDSL